MNKSIFILLLLSSLAVCGQSKKEKTPTLAEQQAEAARKAKQEAAFLDGMKSYLTENYAAAAKVFSAILAEDASADAGVAFMLGKSYAQQNQLPQAAVYVQQAANQEPTNLHYQKYLGWLYDAQNALDKAIAVYEKLTKQSPQDVDAQLTLASLYQKVGKDSDAVRVYDTVEKYVGVTEEISRQKQAILLGQNKVDAAVKEGDKLMAAEPQDVSLLSKQAELLITATKYKDAANFLLKHISKHPNWLDGRLLLAETYRLQNDLGKSGEVLMEAFQLPSISADMRQRIVASFVRSVPATGSSTELEKAIQLAQATVAATPSDSKTQQLLGNLYRQKGLLAEALTAYTAAIKQEKNSFELWERVLEVSEKLQQHETLFNYATQATEYFPNQASIWYYAGVANTQKKDWAETDFAFTEAKRLAAANKPLQGKVLAAWGDALLLQGKKDKALAFWKQAVELGHQSDELKQKIAKAGG